MSVVLTEAAAEKVQHLLQQQETSNMKLRVFVSGGGCSGFQYGFTFDDEIRDTDEVVENYGVGLLVDPMSLDLLKGAEIDYQTSLQGESFVIRNPNAASTCGCGKSFTPSESSDACSHAA
ncbi:MAG: iron-sulfur cluster insertion protein ErpA [Mariprofundaceae bacterium]|nr:iron-sulfur cluster insertion protein ErpA [Mariprofundaceae bacterium]